MYAIAKIRKQFKTITNIVAVMK